MLKRWTIRSKSEQYLIDNLSKALNNLDPSLTNILIQRGIDSFEKAKAFFRPDIGQTHDPFLMKDMDRAVSRLQQAIKKGENILIYGDYDVDGTTSVALVYSFLEKFYSQIDYYIPDRYQEGYGVSFKGIDYASDNDISLVIALDCGIKANEKIAYAQEKGIDFIICDHHLPGDHLPLAHAILDPKQKDCNYPFKELSGCGVGFKFMQAYSIKENLSLDLLYSKLDILAVSICADIVPIIDENRIYTHYGIKKLNQHPQIGFKAMLQTANVKRKWLTVTDVVFTLAPRINAAGRIESAKKAVEVMLSESISAAEANSLAINENNTDRRELDQSITEEAIAMIEADEKLKQQKTTVLYHPDWHKGVIGIVASRCIESYYRPTIILTQSNGMVSGSARSVKGFNVYQAIEQCSELLEQFGGHKYAAGMTLKEENVTAFQQIFEEVVSSSIPEKLLTPEIEIDSEIALNAINSKFYKVLKQFAPFGPQNMKPIFISTGVKDKGFARIVGNNHLKVDVVDPKDPSIQFGAIGFNLGHHLESVQEGKLFDFAYTLEENEWNGTVSLQLNIKDIRPRS